MRNFTLFSSSAAIIILSLLLLTSCSVKKVRTLTPETHKVYPSPPDTARIQYLTSINSSESISGKQSGFNRYLFGKTEPVYLVKPYGITSAGSKIYICDTGIGGLVIIDLKEGSFKQFIPSGKGQLQFPINCSVDSDGSIYVADGNRKQVVIFDSDGKYVHAFGEESESFKPTDVAVSENKIIVASISDHSIYLYNKADYSLESVISGKDSKNKDYLYQPANITNRNEKLYVSDIGDYKVKIFEENGSLLSTIGTYGTGFGQLMRPKGVAVDNDHNIYIVDAAFENVQIFNSEGQLLMYFGGPYKSPGDMWLPADVAIDYNNLEYFNEFVDSEFELQYLIYVTNQYGPGKIGVYGFVKPK